MRLSTHVIFLLLCLVCMLSASAQYNNVQPAILEVRDSSFFIDDGSPNQLIFKYEDSLGVDHVVSLLRGENRLNINKPALLIQQNPLATPFRILPGERVVITKDALGAVYFNSTNGCRNNELLFYKLLIDSIGHLSDIGNLLEGGKVNIQSIKDVQKVEEDIEAIKGKQNFF